MNNKFDQDEFFCHAQELSPDRALQLELKQGWGPGSKGLRPHNEQIASFSLITMPVCWQTTPCVQLVNLI